MHDDTEKREKLKMHEMTYLNYLKTIQTPSHHVEHDSVSIYFCISVEPHSKHWDNLAETVI